GNVERAPRVCALASAPQVEPAMRIACRGCHGPPGEVLGPLGAAAIISPVLAAFMSVAIYYWGQPHGPRELSVPPRDLLAVPFHWLFVSLVIQPIIPAAAILILAWVILAVILILLTRTAEPGASARSYRDLVDRFEQVH